jgi:hypothetical protein
MSFKDLMKKRKEAMETAYNKSSPYDNSGYEKKAKDPRIVTFGLKEDGTENTIIGRFLPSKKFLEGKTSHLWVNKFTHSYQFGTAKLFFNCLQSLGKPCPQCLRFLNNIDWEDRESKDRFSHMFPDRRYLVNFYVIEDEGNPERNGTVVVARLNHSIMKKILEKKKSGIDPFDILEGSEFTMFITKSAMKSDKGEYLPQFSACRFSNKTTELVDGNEKKIDKIINSTIDLDEFINEKDYMSFEEMDKYITKQTGISLEQSTNEANSDDDENESDGSDVVDVDFDDMELDEIKKYAIDEEIMTKKEIAKLLDGVPEKKAKSKLISKIKELTEDDEDEKESDNEKENDTEDEKEDSEETPDFDDMDLDDLKEYATEKDIFTEKQLKKQLEGLNDKKAKAKLIELIKEELGDEDEDEKEDSDKDTDENEDETSDKEIPDFDDMDLEDIKEWAIKNEVLTAKQIEKKIADLPEKKAKNKLISAIEDIIDAEEGED